MEEKMISRGCQNISPFVTAEIFKQCSKRVKDYAVVEICRDTFDPNNVVFKIIEPVYFKRYSVPTCTWGDTPDMKVVLVRLDESLIMVEFEEMADIIQKHTA